MRKAKKKSSLALRLHDWRLYLAMERGDKQAGPGQVVKASVGEGARNMGLMDQRGQWDELKPFQAPGRR